MGGRGGPPWLIRRERVIRVKVRLYGALARYGLGDRKPEFFLDLDDDSTVDALAGRLGLPRSLVRMRVVNGAAVDFAHPLATGDEILLAPAASGGSASRPGTWARRSGAGSYRFARRSRQPGTRPGHRR